MNRQFIEKVIEVAVYQKKVDTKNSYYWQDGSVILPNRLSISNGIDICRVAKVGRNTQISKGQLLGQFSKKEKSVLMKNKPYQLITKIWAIDGYPQFIGYGTIGISNAEGKITRDSDNGDVVVLHTSDNWNTIKIFYLPRMVEYLSSVMDYINTII